MMFGNWNEWDVYLHDASWYGGNLKKNSLMIFF